ncbi:MAG: hypothetical protein ACHQ7N_17610 [Candidatus Methylomirabilales bacterium]
MGDKVELPPLKLKQIAVAGNTQGSLALYGLDEGGKVHRFVSDDKGWVEVSMKRAGS